MRKGKIFIALGLCLFLFASSNVYAAESPITKTETFETESSDFKYDFQEEIELNGSKYKLNKTYYKVLSQSPTIHTVHKTVTAEFDNLYDKQFDINDTSTLTGIVKTKQITVDGKTYNAKLESISYEDSIITNRTAKAETTAILTEDTITDTIEYEFDDEQGGKHVPVTLSKADVAETDETEDVTTTFSVVFHNYDSDVFLINNKLVPLLDENAPVSSEYFDDIKAESSYADNAGTITSIVWNGDPYFSNGELCRNASATLTESRKLYSVKYTGTVNLPDTDGFRAILTYGTDAEEKTGKTTYEVQANAEYLLVEEKSIQPIFIGIGIAVFALLIVIILVIIAKKKKHKQSPVTYV